MCVIVHARVRVFELHPSQVALRGSLSCNRYSGRLVVVAIAPLTPVAAALRLDERDGALGLMRCVKRVYMQGQAVVTLAGEVMPSDAAYNFRLDMRAAEDVFAQLHAHKLPVALLGKYAAYQIKLTKQDLESLADPCLPSLAVVARDQMQEFKRQNPEQFFHLFPLPLQFRQVGGGEGAEFEWFAHLPGGVVSKPYDALVVLMADEDAREGGDAEASSSSSSSSPSSSSLFTRTLLSDNFSAVGNNPPPAPHGVMDVPAVKHAIMTMMQRAVQKSRDLHRGDTELLSSV